MGKLIVTAPERQKLLGKWQSDPADSAAIAAYGDASLEFLSNGGLVYRVQSQEKLQVMLLTYRIEGDVLITDQPSSPKEERTRLEVTPGGKLILFYDKTPSTYVRIGDPAD